MSIEDFSDLLGENKIQLSREEGAVVQAETKYEGYIGQQIRDVERVQSLEKQRIPAGFDYRSVGGLSREAVERLGRIRPADLGQAGRITGVTPAAIPFCASI